MDAFWVIWHQMFSLTSVVSCDITATKHLFVKRTNVLSSVCRMKINPWPIGRIRPTADSSRQQQPTTAVPSHNRQQRTTAIDNSDILHSRSTMEKARKRSSHPKASSGATRKKRQVRQGVSTATPMEIDDADTNTPTKMPVAPPSPHYEYERNTQNASETSLDLQHVDDKASPSDNERKGMYNLTLEHYSCDIIAY